MTLSLRLISPALCLSFFAFLLLGIDAFSRTASLAVRRAGFWTALIGIIAALLLLPAPAETPILFGHQMLVWDGLSYFLSWVALLTIFFVLMLSEQYRPFTGLRLSAYFSLLLLAGVGLLFIGMCNDFLMIFIAIEMISVPSFILVGYLRDKERSSEGALKFFLIGAFSSAMLAYGASIIYGLIGSTSLLVLRQNMDLLQNNASLTLLALFFIIVSFGFKIALVPFHQWVPDAFEGAPIPIAAFLSVAPKVAGAAITLRVFSLVLGQSSLGVMTVLAVLAAITMTVANIIGLKQTNVVRLLAYSSIAHMGYLLLGLVAATPTGTASLYLYGWAYLFMNLGAFAVIVCVSGTLDSQELSAYAGLAKRSPALSALLALFLLSLAGIPPTAGFIAKFYVFAAAFQAHWLWLVIVAGVNSVIAVGYYFKILYAMYFQKPAEGSPVTMTLSARWTLWATSALTLVLGIIPQFFVSHATALTAASTSVSEPANAQLTSAPPPASSMPAMPTTLPIDASVPEPSQQ